MIESHPIPALAKTALALVQREYVRQRDAIGVQTVEAMGLDPSLDWQVNFDTGVVTRDVPDPPEGDRG